MPGKIINRVEELAAKRRREVPGLPASYRKIGEEVGMNPNTVGQWINNNVKRYDADKLAAWCDYLQCDIGDLLVYIREE